MFFSDRPSDNQRTQYELELFQIICERYNLGGFFLPDGSDIATPYNPKKPDALLLPSNGEFPSKNGRLFDIKRGLKTAPICGIVEFYQPKSTRSILNGLFSKTQSRQASMYAIDCRSQGINKSDIMKAINTLIENQFFNNHPQYRPPFRILFVREDGNDILFCSNIGMVPYTDRKQRFAINPSLGQEYQVLSLLPDQPSPARLHLKTMCSTYLPGSMRFNVLFSGRIGPKPKRTKKSNRVPRLKPTSLAPEVNPGISQ